MCFAMATEPFSVQQNKRKEADVLCKSCQMALQVYGGCYNIYSYYMIEKGEIKWLKKLLQHLD